MKNDKEFENNRFIFRILSNEKGLIYKLNLGEEQSEIIENISLVSNYSDTYDLSKNELVPICTINQVGIHSLTNEDLKDNPFISELVSYINNKDTAVFMASLWRIEDTSKVLSRILYHEAPTKRNQIVEFVQWGFSENLLINWSLIIPAEQGWLYNIGGDHQIPTKIGKRILKAFRSGFSKKSNKGLKFIYKRKNSIVIYPHPDIAEGGSLRVTFSPFKDIPAFQVNYTVQIKTNLEKSVIKGPKIELFEIPRGTSRICILLDETAWITAVGSLSCVKHFTDWKYEIFQRFSRYQGQCFTPLLFLKNLKKDLIDFVFHEYRIRSIITINSIPKILKTEEYLEKNLITIPLSSEIPSHKLFDLIQILIKKQLELPHYYSEFVRFDCLIIFPEDKKLTLYSIPFIRYLNALPLIISDELEQQVSSYRAYLKTNIIFGVGLESEIISKIKQIDKFRFVINITGNDLIDVVLNIQKTLLSFQRLDFIIEEYYYIYLEIPEIFKESLEEISKYCPGNFIEKLFNSENIDKTEFITESLINGHLMDIVNFQKLFKIYHDLYNRVLVERGVDDVAKINFSTIGIANQHVTLISQALETPQLMNAIFYATSKKLYVLPLNSPNRAIKRRLRKKLEEIHSFMSQTPIFYKMEYNIFLEKLKDYNKIASNHIIPKKLSEFLFSRLNFPNSESDPFNVFKFISLFPDEVNILYEKVGKTPLEHFFVIGRLIGKSWKDTNEIVLRNIVNSYLTQRKPFLFFSTSLVDKKYDKKIHNLNQNCINVLSNYNIEGFSTNTFENYRHFLNYVENCTHFYYWGHGTSEELNLEDEDHPNFPIPISVPTLEKLSNPDGKLCVLTSCEGGNILDPNQLNLAQTFQRIGFDSVIASFTFLPTEGGTNFHINLLMNLFEEITVGELLKLFKSNHRVYFSEFFILFGDPTLQFPRLFTHERKNIRNVLDKKIRELFPLTKRKKSPI